MATLPTARVLQATSGGGLAKGSIILCVMACTQNGQLTARQYSRVQEVLNDHGYGPAPEAVAHNTQLNKLPSLVVGLTTATPGAINNVDTTGVTGTAAPSFSGAPYDDERLRIEIVDGGSLGTAGISFRVSRDGGASFLGGTIRLGTALTYLIPGTGVTVTFGASGRTLVAGDVLLANCTGPMWDAAGLSAGFDLVRNQPVRPRIILLCGDVDDSTDVQDVIDEISAMETEAQQYTRVLFSTRQRFPLCKMQKTKALTTGSASATGDLTFAASGHTITRASGSYVTDGFVVGQSVTVAGSASNNGVIGVLTAVSATVLTFGSGVVNETITNGLISGVAATISGAGPGLVTFAATTITRGIGSFITDGFKVGMMVTVAGSASNNGELGPLTAVSATVLTFAAGGVSETISGLGLTLTGTEPKSTARAAFGAIVGTTPQTAKVYHRASAWFARARRKSPINSTRKMRPSSWACAFRIMGHQENTSPAKKALGGLEGWSMYDANGELEFEAHDERIEGGILAFRGGCLTSDVELGGVFVALPLTLDEDDASLSRLPKGLVCDLAARISLRESNLILSSDVTLKADGTGFIKPGEAEKIEKIVTNRLRAVLLKKDTEGQRATDVSWKMARDVDLRDDGAEIPCETDVEGKGYIEQIKTTVRLSKAGG
jgi:hypothetical protein